MNPTDLTDFLVARIAEDEEDARFALKYAYDELGTRHEWNWLHSYQRPGAAKRGGWSSSHHKGAPTPTRVLAECEAKRRIIEQGTDWRHRSQRDPYTEGVRFGFYVTFCHLAAVYVDHPDYNPDWRP